MVEFMALMDAAQGAKLLEEAGFYVEEISRNSASGKWFILTSSGPDEKESYRTFSSYADVTAAVRKSCRQSKEERDDENMEL